MGRSICRHLPTSMDSLVDTCRLEIRSKILSRFMGKMDRHFGRAITFATGHGLRRDKNRLKALAVYYPTVDFDSVSYTHLAHHGCRHPWVNVSSIICIQYGTFLLEIITRQSTIYLIRHSWYLIIHIIKLYLSVFPTIFFFSVLFIKGNQDTTGVCNNWSNLLWSD